VNLKNSEFLTIPTKNNKQLYMKTIHINLWGGPGIGKSTMAAGIFAALKWEQIDCELIGEYAKQIVWEESFPKLNNQIYLFAKQYAKHYNLEGKVNVIITDSPIPMGCVYDNNRTSFLKEITLSEYNKFDNLNYVLSRTTAYNPNGRMQTEDEAKSKDTEILKFLNDNSIKYESITSSKDSIQNIIERIKREMGRFTPR